MTFRGQLNTSTDAIEQWHSELDFKGVKLARGSGLTEVEQRYGPMDAPGFRDRHKGAEVTNVHLS